MNIKTIFKIIFLFTSLFSLQAQVGIGTSTPHASAVLDLTATDKSLLVTRVANTAAITNPTNGMIIYDISQNCFKLYQNNAWTGCLGSNSSGLITALNCAGATSSGTIYQGIAVTNIAYVITYTGGNGSTYTGQTVASTGVLGLTAITSSGTFATGNGALIYTIVGTAATSGTASFAINIGGQTCTLNVPVVGGQVATLNCAGATNNGTLTNGQTASGVSSVIAYTGGNGGAHGGQTVASTGVTGLTATLAAGSFATGAGNLTYTITGTPSGAGTASFAINIGGQSCTLTRTVVGGQVATLDCAGATNNGTLTGGTAASGVSSVIAYTGGNGAPHSGQTVTSTGVTGLTATLAAGSFATGAGTLTYTITGTPATGGTASFAINIGGQSCTLTRTVAASITIPATITLAQNKYYMLASIYDQDYLPYTPPTGSATTATQAANGSNEAVTVNVQGSITTTGIAVKIPVTATGSGTLPAYSTTITIPASMTEDGISRNLTLSWASQAYTIATTSINATITAVGGTLNAKKLDINAGVGNDALGVLIGQFTYPYNNAGNTTNYDIRGIAGIPDKMFGVADNTGSTTSHMMLYLPVMAEDGNIWLNNNLGAHYANLNHGSFNLAQQATSATDYLAYGSSFQFGRKPDGHELVTFTSSTTGTAVNGTTSTKSNNPTHALFITMATNPDDWRTTQDDTLWATEASPNNPCPVGYKVPTYTEYSTLVTAAGITNLATAASSTLKFISHEPRTGSTMTFGGTYSHHRCSTVSAALTANTMFFDSTRAIVGGSARAIGFPVRCIKN